MTYLGAAPTTTASRKSQVTYRYLMTAGQSVISGSDLNNNTLSCDPLDTEIFMNGLKLDSTDTTITATQVTLAVPAAAGDEIEVVAYRTFESADHYDKSTSDTRYVNAAGDTMTGDLTVDTNTFHVDVADNKVGIGTTAPTNNLTIIDGGATPYGADATLLLDIKRNTTNTGATNAVGIRLANNSNGFNIKYGGTADKLDIIGGSGDTVATFNNQGGVTLPYGAYLGGTGAANHLDEYEEGTCTITLSSTGTAPTFSTGGTFTATYVKIGRTVTVHGYTGTVVISSAGTGICKVVGLPFTISSGTYSMAHFTHGTLFGASQHGYIETPTNFFYPIVTNSINGVNYSTGTFYMMFTATYVCT